MDLIDQNRLEHPGNPRSSKQIGAPLPLAPRSPSPVGLVALNKLEVGLLITSQSIFFCDFFEELYLVHLLSLLQICPPLPLLHLQAHLFLVRLLNLSLLEESLVSAESGIGGSDEAGDRCILSAMLQLVWEVVEEDGELGEEVLLVGLFNLRRLPPHRRHLPRAHIFNFDLTLPAATNLVPDFIPGILDLALHPGRLVPLLSVELQIDGVARCIVLANGGSLHIKLHAPNNQILNQDLRLGELDFIPEVSELDLVGA